MAEAKRLWEIDISTGPTITTLQAALVMQLLLNISGMDKVGRMYGRQIIGLARDLGLFGYLTHIDDPRLLQAHQFMAWSLFCLQGCVVPPTDPLRCQLTRQQHHRLFIPLQANVHKAAKVHPAGRGQGSRMVRGDLDPVSRQRHAHAAALRRPLQRARRHGTRRPRAHDQP